MATVKTVRLCACGCEKYTYATYYPGHHVSDTRAKRTRREKEMKEKVKDE